MGSGPSDAQRPATWDEIRPLFEELSFRLDSDAGYAAQALIYYL